jgi:hypothetical protein
MLQKIGRTVWEIFVLSVFSYLMYLAIMNNVVWAKNLVKFIIWFDVVLYFIGILIPYQKWQELNKLNVRTYLMLYG